MFRGGSVSLKMARRISIRLLAVAMVFIVGAFAMEAAGHWHANPTDEQHCQVCHIANAAVPQPTTHIAAQTPVAVERFAIVENHNVTFAPVCSQRIPRAPPA